jgi:KDO2-lipid IV(A) lauroyltransferase
VSFLLRGLVWAAERIPAAWLSRLGAWLGAAVFALLRIRRAYTVEAIERSLALPRTEATRLARRVYRGLGASVFELLRVGRLGREEAESLLGAAGRASLDRLLAKGRGLLVLTGHLGNWDLLACAAARAGYPLHVITRELKATSVNRLWMAARASCGVQLHPARGSARAILRALRRGEVVALVLDQHEPEGEVVPFFGRPAATSRSLARLARATGAPVVPAFLVRAPSAGRPVPGYQLVLEDPITLSFGAEGDLRQATALFNLVLERQIRRYPDQWLWLHRRWKVEPGAPQLQTHR